MLQHYLNSSSPWVIPREGVESFFRDGHLFGRRRRFVIPREGVESISALITPIFSGSLKLVIPREGVESFLA